MITAIHAFFLLSAIAAPPSTDPVRSDDQLERVIIRCKPEALIRGTAVLMRDLATV